MLADLRRVAEITGSPRLTTSSYDTHGRYFHGTAAARFGSWGAALERAGLSPQSAATSQELLEDLNRVAGLLGRDYISFKEYRRHGRWGERPFNRVFGGWHAAVEAAGLAPHPNIKVPATRNQLLENIEAVWVALGRQPTYGEMEKPLSKFSSTTYAKHFGGWRNALAEFVSWVNEEEGETPDSLASPERVVAVTPVIHEDSPSRPRVRRTNRNTNLRLRFLVMRRDDFKCRFCGRSPAQLTGLILHVDHVVAWERGGETELANLQTLCEQCNLGKSNLGVTP